MRIHLLQHQRLPPSIREISGLPIASSAVSDCGTWRPQLSQSHHTVFIFSSHHLTVPSQSGLSYFVTNTCHSQQLSGDLIPFRILEEDSRKNKQYINSYKIKFLFIHSAFFCFNNLILQLGHFQCTHYPIVK